MKYQVLVLSHAGLNCFSMLGELYKLFQNDKLKNIKVFSGSSAGGAIAALLALNFSPLEIFTILNKCLPFKFKKDSIKIKLVLEKYVKNETFKSVYEKNNNIVIITSFDVKTNESIYFNYLTHPDTLLLDAILNTINLPIFTRPPERMLDGALCTPIPIKFTKEFIMTNNLNYSNMIAILCDYYNKDSDSFKFPIYHEVTLIINKLFENITDYELDYLSKNDLLLKFKAISYDAFEDEITLNMALKMFVDVVNNNDDNK